MQVLDEKVAPARSISEQRADLCERGGIDLTAFWRAPRPPPSAGGIGVEDGHWIGLVAIRGACVPDAEQRERAPRTQPKVARANRRASGAPLIRDRQV